MRLKGRRQSTNVEKQSPQEKSFALEDRKMMRDFIGNTNERLKDKTPVEKMQPGINERMNTINPGTTQPYGGYKMNIRTMRDSNKPGELSKSNKQKDAKFFLK